MEGTSTPTPLEIEITSRIDKHRRKVSALEDILVDLRAERIGRLSTNGVSHKPAATPTKQSEPEAEAGPLKPTELANRVAQVLRVAGGGPMKTSDIAKRLISEGVTATGNQTMTTSIFGAIRRRTDLFRKASRGMYELVE